MKRKKTVAFNKVFKKTMKDFRNQIKCIECTRLPAPEEKIDDWHINKSATKIELVCTECAPKMGLIEQDTSDV